MVTWEEVNKNLESCPNTIFDSFRIEVDLRKRGDALREEIINLTNMFGRINELASNAVLLCEQSEIRREDVIALAWGSIPPGMKTTQARIFVKTVIIEYGSEKTCINDEDRRVSIYKYISNRGKDKVREIEKVLDVGRSLLSWDKQEHSNYNK